MSASLYKVQTIFKIKKVMMQQQIKSVQSTAQKQYLISQKRQPQQASSQVQMVPQMDKTYDDFEPKKSLISVLVKIVPMTLYLVLKIVTDQHLALFIIITLLLAVDFWITKNILGPKLVGLKWFSIQDENNQEKWCFASAGQKRIISKINAVSFWIPQLFAILFWFAIIIFNIVTLGLFWVGLAIFSCLLLVINLAFFLQCKGDHQKKANFFSKKLGLQLYKEEQDKSKSLS